VRGHGGGGGAGAGDGGGEGGARGRRAAAVPGRHAGVAGREGGRRRGGPDGLGGAVAPVRPEEALQPGQLYFVLPAAMRRRPLQAEEMAALAIRASAALAGDHDGPLVFPEAAAAAGAGARCGKVCRRSRRTTVMNVQTQHNYNVGDNSR
jgi:hypothetical protein